ncbi:MAG: choice-of-anchor D domain-containing protein, partial [Myxococcaceae bacterium]
MWRGLVIACLGLAACQLKEKVGDVSGDIEAQPASVDFGTTAPGFPVERTVTLSNRGRGPLTLGETFLSGESPSVFTVQPLEAQSLSVAESVTVRLVYAPTAEGSHAARLVVRSDASNQPELLIPLAGTAVSADPCAKVTCTQPPGPCFQEAGSCAGGSCSYLP